MGVRFVGVVAGDDVWTEFELQSPTGSSFLVPSDDRLGLVCRQRGLIPLSGTYPVPATFFRGISIMISKIVLRFGDWASFADNRFTRFVRFRQTQTP